MYGSLVAQLLTAHVLKQCGDNLTRENIMRQASNLKKVRLPLLLPGVTAETTPDDFAPFQTLGLARFDGKSLGAVRRGDGSEIAGPRSGCARPEHAGRAQSGHG